MKISPNSYSKPLNPADVAEIEEATLHACLKKTKIVDRAWYIYKTIAKHYNLKMKTSDYDVEDVLEFDDYKDKDELFMTYFLTPFEKPDGVIQVVYKNDEVSLVDSWGRVHFPCRWLYCDFESELIEGIKAQKKKEEEKELRLRAKKKGYRAKSKIVARLKKNMTPEEIEIVFGKEIKDA